MVISSKLINTRVPHKCWGCALGFPKGTRMMKVNWIDGSDLSSSYWCEICDAFWSKHMHYGDEISQGDLAGEEIYKKFKIDYENRPK